MRFLTLVLLIALVFGASLPGAERAGIGDTLPDGLIHDPEGASRSLLEVVAKKPTVLIFYRGGWCPYCNAQLSGLAEAEASILEAGYQIVAISPDQPTHIKASKESGDFGYQLYSDSRMTIAQALGIAFQVSDQVVDRYKTRFGIDLEASSGETHHLLPHPAVFLVDPEGVIRFVHVNENYRERMAPEEILGAINGLVPAP